MIARAVARYIRISPRKTRLVANYIKGKNVGEALAILTNLNKRSCEYVEEALRSAIANAKRNAQLDEGSLYISRLTVDGGPMLKRFRAGSMGRAMMIRHRMSHITVELDAHKKAQPKISPEPKAAKARKKPLFKAAKKRGK